MVFTQLLLDASTPELRKFPFGVLAAQPEEVAMDLVPKILGVQGNGNKVGKARARAAREVLDYTLGCSLVRLIMEISCCCCA
jgi:hypothetical protein